MLGAIVESLVYIAGLWFIYQGLSLLVKHAVLNRLCGHSSQSLPAAHKYCGNCGRGREN